jgi:predicted N-acetyltransferase YhbS
MTAPAVKIRLQTPKDLPALKKLNEESFGPGRFARAAFRIRERAAPEPRLNLCVEQGGAIIGAVQFTPVSAGGVGGALLLGPLIVERPTVIKDTGSGSCWTAWPGHASLATGSSSSSATCPITRALALQ